VEEERLARRALEWLETERSRPPFSVEATERGLDLEVSGLAVSVRVDRVDALPGGGRVIIDYKTGDNVAIARWFGERPDEPQLPLYSLAFGDDLEALAFARVRAGGMAYCGVARAAEVAPGIRRFEDTRHAEDAGSWQAQRAAWRRTLEALAADFASGRAEVAPKDPTSTCAHCGLTALCRINEATALDEGREEAEP
jgi:RecB family exonuclease